MLVDQRSDEGFVTAIADEQRRDGGPAHTRFSRQIVDRDHAFAARDERVNDMIADITRASRDQGAHMLGISKSRRPSTTVRRSTSALGERRPACCPTRVTPRNQRFLPPRKL